MTECEVGLNTVFLTQVGGILKPFAWIMGVILDAIYEFFNLFGIENIALCIIVFTLVIKMLMLPLTIKQQKYTRLSSKMSPELTKIQAKYKGKKDEESLRRQQAETQEVYAKYGTSPMGGCLPLLISLPIMFALYRVIYAVPAYVDEIGNLYTQISNALIGIENHAEIITNFISTNAIVAENNLATYAIGSQEYTNSLIDILVKFNTENWTALFNISEFAGLKEGLASVVDNIISANNLFGLNILDAPKWNSISVIIPILAVVSQFVQSKLQSVTTSNKKNDDNPMANSTKTMMTIMPIMSGVFCLMLPIGVGLYWIASSVFTVIQSIFINRYLDKTDINEMIEKNMEKSKKKKAKLGVDYGNKMAEVAKTSTKAIDTDYDKNAYKKNNKARNTGSDYKRSEVSYKASSIAANANILGQRRQPEIKKDEAEGENDKAE